MSLVFTLMTSETRRQTGEGGGEGVHYLQPANREIHHGGACLFAYILLFRHVFLYLLRTLCASLKARKCECAPFRKKS